MGTPSIDDLDGLLASLNQLKPPGASKTKIATITSLCVNNIKVESNVVQSLYTALKNALPTHKLGALYVIDSVVRQWMVQAKSAGQSLVVEGRGEPGTYPAAIKRVTELMPALFQDILERIPAEQKPKLENMVSIWERGNTFPASTLADFKAKLSGAASNPPANDAAQDASRTSGSKFMAPIPSKPVGTPVGLPPRNLYENGLIPAQPSERNGAQSDHPATVPAASQPGPSSDVNSILAALSRTAPAAAPAPLSQPVPQAAVPPPQSNPTAPQQQLPPGIAALFAQQQPPTAQVPPANPYGYASAAPQAMSIPGYQVANPYASIPPQQPPSIPQGYPLSIPPQIPQPTPQADPLAPLRGLLPESILNDTQKLIPALKVLQDLQKEGVPPQNWGPVLRAFEEQYQNQAGVAPPAGIPNSAAYGNARGRSRSPDRGGSRGRGSPVYGSYDADSSHRQQSDDDGNRGGRKYRQRSPIGRNSPVGTAMNGKPMQPKYIGFDNTLPPDNIKVLSRTLFVGGASGTQQEIHDLFARFGAVQTCISNRDKRHAFVKMTTRTHALAAKAGMEEMQARNDRDIMNVARQTKWGVGFGPRECCDYGRGESIIPIHKLTEADMKWLLTAEFGGTGGQAVAGGMVLEEPDIEIGAGVSSKAMSKRIGPADPASFSGAQGGHNGGGGGGKRGREERGGRGGRHQHRSGGGGGGGGNNNNNNSSNHFDQGYGGGGYSGVSGGSGQQQQQLDSYSGYARPEPVAVATPPAVPGFGFSFGGLAGSGNLGGQQGGSGYR